MKTYAEFKGLVQSRMANRKPFENEKPVLDLLESLARGSVRRAVLTLPSQHSKSTNSDIFAAYMIGLNPLIRIIAATYSQNLARKHSRTVKEILRSPEFREFFGWEPVFKKDAEDDWQIDWPGASSGSTFLARSVESPALGETADFLLVDDPLSGPNSAYSPTKQERAWHAIQNVLFQRLTPEGIILMIATLWTESDPSIKAMIGWKASATPSTYVNLAALNDDGKSSWVEDVVTGKRECVEPYPVLWHEWRNLEFIEAKRAEMLTADFETQYQGNAVATGGLCSDEDWKVYEDTPEDIEYAAIVVDTGLERGEGNDPTLSLAIGYGPKGFYCLDAVQGRWDVADISHQIVCQLERVARRLGATNVDQYPFKVPLVLIEKAALGRPVRDLLAPQLLSYMVHLCTPEGLPKTIRARAQAHHIQHGRVFLPKHGDFVREMKRQWVGFPRAKHDEFVDTLSYGLRHAPTVKMVHEYLVGTYLRHEKLTLPDLSERRFLTGGDEMGNYFANSALEDLDKTMDEMGVCEIISPATQRAMRRW